MKHLTFPLFVLPFPVLAHDAVVSHGHDGVFLVPAVTGFLAGVSLILAVRRLARILA